MKFNKKVYSVDEIKKIEQKEFKLLKNSFILMKRAGIRWAKKIEKISQKKKNNCFVGTWKQWWRRFNHLTIFKK